MEFVDREPKYPNRVKIVPESGDPFYATVTRADEPVTEGTPLNAETFNQLQDEFSQAANGSIVANALKGSVSGSMVTLADVSSLEHEMAVVVRRENLLPYPYIDTTETESGITWTDNGDGTITANGTATANSTFSLMRTGTIPPGQYVFSAGYSDTANISQSTVFAYLYVGDAYCPVVGGSINGWAFTVDKELSQFIVNLRIMAGTTVENLTFTPQLEIGVVATEHKPYVADLSAVTVSKLSRNILPYPYIDTTKTLQGITFTDNGDGTITANGTATHDTSFVLSDASNFGQGVSLGDVATFSGCPQGGSADTYYIYSAWTGHSDIGSGITLDNPKDTWFQLRIMIKAGVTVENLVFKPQLELNPTVTEYTPFVKVEYSPDADGIVKGVTSLYPTMTLQTDTDGVVMDVEYNRDINKAFAELVQAIISLGGNV